MRPSATAFRLGQNQIVSIVIVALASECQDKILQLSLNVVMISMHPCMHSCLLMLSVCMEDNLQQTSLQFITFGCLTSPKSEGKEERERERLFNIRVQGKEYTSVWMYINMRQTPLVLSAIISSHHITSFGDVGRTVYMNCIRKSSLYVSCRNS